MERQQQELDKVCVRCSPNRAGQRHNGGWEVVEERRMHNGENSLQN
jgi:hypothetical protein